MNSFKKLFIVGGMLGSFTSPALSAQKTENQEEISKVLTLPDKTNN